MSELYGYDIDGVLLPGALNKDTVKPDLEKPFVIISGRLYTPRTWGKTYQELSHLLQYAPIYLRPDGDRLSRQDGGKWKSEMINRLGVTRFYEDDRIQAEEIRQGSPQCELIFLGVDH